jgi:surfeit locus 1 family protein
MMTMRMGLLEWPKQFNGLHHRLGNGSYLSMRFKPTLVSTILALAGIVITVLLGNWQTGRAHHKAQLQARMDAASSGPAVLVSESSPGKDLPYQRIAATGRFLAVHTIYLDNRLRDGVAGYEVITPLALSAAKAVLVNRGWVEASTDRSRLPEVSTPGEVMQVVGLALPANTKFLELSSKTVAGPVWQNLDFEKYAVHTGLVLLPVIVQMHNDIPDGLKRQWPRVDMRTDTHRAYALQWYTMAAAIFLLFLFLNVRRRPK